jgi:glycine/D-amino acid oxidase-like deaminating enzyme
MERSGSDWRAVTARGAVSAKWVVVATDVYGTGPWRQIAREQIRLPYFNIATNPLGDVLQNSVLPERQGAWDTQKVLRSFRMDSTGRLIFGSVGALRGTGAPIHRAWVRRTIRALFPQLNAIELEDEWYGTIGMTTDNLPRFHQLASNVVAVSGYNGRGIAPGTAFGKVICDYICGDIGANELPLPSTAVSQPSFPGLREAVYELGSQAAHLLWTK